MAQIRPAKRPRTTAVENEPQGPLERHEEFWLVDGNIVLVAGNVAFRIYRGLLVTQSTVFADMFASSSPDPDETIDGCPVVHVEDSPEDFVHLLRVLLPTTHRRFYREDAYTNYTFEEVFAVIRLAHKYNIEDVQKQALYSLREYTFNDDFEKWEGEREESIAVAGRCAIGAVNLARLLDRPEMLLIALYKCVGLGTGLLDGWKRRDGSMEHLSQDDVKRCIAASSELSHSSVASVYAIFRPESSERCKQRSCCEDALRRMLAHVLKVHAKEASDGSMVIDTWKHVFEQLGGYELCDVCWNDVRDRDVAGRRAIWRRFPDIFDVEAEHWGYGPL